MFWFHVLVLWRLWTDWMHSWMLTVTAWRLDSRYGG